MAHILAPTTQWQMGITKNPANASPTTAKMWGSLLLKQNKKGSSKSSAKFRVFSMKSENSTVNRIEKLLNLDLTPYTDRVIAEYIWYIYFSNIRWWATSGWLNLCEHPVTFKIMSCHFATGLEGPELTCVASQGYDNVNDVMKKRMQACNLLNVSSFFLH